MIIFLSYDFYIVLTLEYAIPCERFESRKFRENLGYKSFVYDIIVVRKVKN